MKVAPEDTTFDGVFGFWNQCSYPEKYGPGCRQVCGQNVLLGSLVVFTHRIEAAGQKKQSSYSYVILFLPCDLPPE